MKKNTARKITNESYEIDRLNAELANTKFDLELATRKNIRLRQAHTGLVKKIDKSIEQKVQGKLAADENRKAREKMLVAQENAFISIMNSVDKCLPFKVQAQVKKMYDTDDCKECSCSIHCKTVSTTHKAVKRYVKGNGQVHRKANIQASRTVEKGIITISIDGAEVQTFKGNNWKSVSKNMREYFAQDTRLTISQIAGFTHKGPGNKYESLFYGRS